MPPAAPVPKHLAPATGRAGQVDEPAVAGDVTSANEPATSASTPEPATRPGKRVQGGVATAELTLSARVGENAELFAQILALHVPSGSLIADVTYGLGAFWKKVAPGSYRVLASDIALKPDLPVPLGFTLRDAVDCRALPHTDASLDALVLDPPYMEGMYRREVAHMAGSGTHAAFRRAYSQSAATPPADDAPRWHEAVIDLYARAGREAARALRPGGVFIVKCQDEVSANTQRLTHVELITGYESLGFYCKDLFVLVRANSPAVSRLKTQVHARKNHSYFLVFSKQRARHASARSFA
ncbi:MAG TPA: hypothetical protein VGB85_30815 [Nannocystis sp.]